MRSLLQLGKQFAPAPLKSTYRRLRAAARELKRMPRRRRDAARSTRHSFEVLATGTKLHTYLGSLSLDRLRPHAEALAAVSQLYCEHRFDLLGSGWMQVGHGVECAGVDGHRYAPKKLQSGDRYRVEDEVTSGQLAESRNLEALIDADYRPIDWHVDFKSGYRWSPTAWYLDAFPPPPPGADVKVPWELGRLQHLPQLAAAALLSEQGIAGFTAADVYRAEFRNQTLDFLSRNPPRFGVNWACTMDVGIRIANLLLAHDLFVAGGARFDEPFERELVRSVWDHARHIAENLEWSPTVRSNHYLANVVGLLFAAAYLPVHPQVDAWLAFAVQELIRAVEEQFRPDGANFEASTCYHRLSAEMIAYGTALVIGLSSEKRRSLQAYDVRLAPLRPTLQAAPISFYPSPLADTSSTPFPPSYWDRLQAMLDFTTALTKPSGELVQIGDNDAGRFCKPVPRCELSVGSIVQGRFQNLDGYFRLPSALPASAVYPYENSLRPIGTVAALGGLLRTDLSETTSDEAWESDLIAALAARVPRGAHLQRTTRRIDSQHQAVNSLGRASLRHQLTRQAFPDFGVYVYRSPRLYLVVRCGGTGWIEGRGHAHEDQLAIELTIDGVDQIRDPGTCLYTSAPQQRNRYRSRAVHFVPVSRRDVPASRFAALFALPSLVAAECRTFEPFRFVGALAAEAVKRTVEILDDCVRVVDSCSDESKSREYIFSPDVTAIKTVAELSVPVSPGYGWQERESGLSFDEGRSDDRPAAICNSRALPRSAAS